MNAEQRFPRRVVAAFDEAQIIGVRAGADHRFTGVWVIVIEGRVFARSWNDKPAGWFRAFLEEPAGIVRIGVREVKVRGRRTRSERLRDAVSAAYREKYATKGSQKWVRGFALPERAANTMEFIPR